MKLKTGIIALVVIGSFLAMAPTATASCQTPYNEQERVECLADEAVDNGWTLVWDAYRCAMGGSCTILQSEN